MDFSKNDLSKVRKGDNIWNYFAQLWETVMEIEFGDGFPIKFENGNECDFSGREQKDDVGPTYFWNEIHFDIPDPPKRMMKKELRIWVSLRQNGEPGFLATTEAAAEDWRAKGYQVEEFSKEIEIPE